MTTFILCATLLAMTAMLTFAASRAWRGWLDFKRLELDRAAPRAEATEGEIGTRIELADVRERLKKLEAIASGVEL